MKKTMDVKNNPEAYATRSEKRDHGIAAWRADMLSKKTKSWQWAAIVLVYFSLSIAIAVGIPAPYSVAMIVFISLMAWLAINTLTKRDASITALARLTPIIVMSTLQGQVTILQRSIELLLKRLDEYQADPSNVLFAMQAVLNAARPIMERGGIEPQTASAEGYPAWPEVDRTEMPTAPGDFLTVHAMRLDATGQNLARIAQERVAFEETVARIAGEVVPPLRAIEAVVSPDAHQPIGIVEIDEAAA